jgi:hypothetical protein
MSTLVVALPHAPSTKSLVLAPTEALVDDIVRAALPSGESDVLEAMVRTALPSGESGATPTGDLALASTWKYSTGSSTVPGMRVQSCFS